MKLSDALCRIVLMTVYPDIAESDIFNSSIGMNDGSVLCHGHNSNGEVDTK